MLYVYSDLNIYFDMKVYMCGFLRMFGFCKVMGFVLSYFNEIEFFYMLVDLVIGEWKNMIIIDEYVCYSILFDKESYDWVEGFMVCDDGEVFMIGDG